MGRTCACVIMLVARRHKADIKEFAANRIKQSLTGHGHAGKAQMQRAESSINGISAKAARTAGRG